MKARYYIFHMLLVLFVSATFAQETSQPRKFDFPKRNSVYIQNHLHYPVISNYDRIIPISNHFGFIPKIGIVGLGDYLTIKIESSVFFGGNKHFGEIGPGIVLGLNHLLITMNYRYMADSGFLLKVGFATGNIKPYPMLGIGYSI